MTAARSVAVRLDWRTAGSVPLAHSELAPIATCHWQWIGNIFEAEGSVDAWRRLGLSWGCRWMGGPVLFGLASWPQLLRETCGAEVSIRTYPSAADARAAELGFSAQGLLFVTEVDAWFLPAAHRERTHAVHAVLVLARDERRVRFVDATISPAGIERSAEQFELMRANPCHRRVEPHKLYLIERGPQSTPSPAQLLDAVRAHLGETLAMSLATFARFVVWAETSESSVDVCRAAGERFQAARLFEYLAEHGVADAVEPAELLDKLADDWYLVHMLTADDRGATPRARARVLRLLKQLAVSEREVAEVILK